MEETQLTGIVHSDDEFSSWLDVHGLHGVRTLIAWDARLTDHAARALAACNSVELMSIDLSWNRIGFEGARALVRSRATKLRLYHNDLGPAGASQLALHGARLTALNVCGNSLGDRGLVALADGELAGVTELALGFNDLGVGTGRVLAGGPWKQLARLNVRANRLDADSCASLLAGDLPLVELHVDENALGEAGIAALVAAPGFARLELLNLGGTELDDAALAILATARSSSLTELRLHDNDVSNAAIAAVREALPHCEVRV